MGLLDRHTGGGNGYGMDSTFGSGRSKGKARKWLIITTAVLLIIAIGTSAGLNIAIMFDDDDEDDETSITYLNVQAIDLSKYSGASDDATLISVGTSFRAAPSTGSDGSDDSDNSDSANASSTDDAKPKAKDGAVPIEGLSVVCNPYTQTKDGKFQSAAEAAKKKGDSGGNSDNSDMPDESGGLSFSPTDATGCAKIPLSTGGTGVLTMSTGNDAYYGISNGIPTQHCTLVNSGHKWSTYDSYTYLGASDTGTSYNLDSNKPSTAAFAFGGPLDKQQNSASDTWHIAGQLHNSKNNVAMPEGTLVYCVSSNGCSYGAAIVGDKGNGSGGGSMADLFMPFNKYYGKYGLTQHGPNDDGGVVGEGPNLSYRKAVVWAYVQSKGVADPQAWNNAVYADNPDNKLYKLDDSGDQLNGKPRGQALMQMALQDQAWPSTMTGGASAGGSSDTGATYYRVSTEMSTGSGSGFKLTDDGKGSSAHGLGTDMFDISTCYGSEAVVNPGKIAGEPKYVLLFWTTVEQVGAGVSGADISGVDVTAPQYIENNHGGLNPMRCDARHIPVKADSGPNKYIPCKYSALPDCTSWAWGRYYDVHHVALKGGSWPSNPGANNRGLKRVNSPVAGGFVTWSGHIAFIESVQGNKITISESGSHFCNQNVNKGLPHPWYQVVTFNSVKDLAAHIKGQGSAHYWA